MKTKIDVINHNDVEVTCDVNVDEKQIEAGDIVPLLSKGGESYTEKWLKEQLHGHRFEFSNKYTTKGIEVEDEAIQMIGDYLMLENLKKNEERKNDEHFTGECDIRVGDDWIIDAKSSWGLETFPMFKDKLSEKDYYYQAQVYMALYGATKYTVAYALVNTPQKLIEKEAYWYAKENNIDNTPELLQHFTDKMTFDNLPSHLRVKTFSFDRNDEDIEFLRTQVEKARLYIEQLKSKL